MDVWIRTSKWAAHDFTINSHTFAFIVNLHFGYFCPWDKMGISVLSCIWLFVTSWTADCQASLSMGFFRREHWSGLPFPPPGGSSRSRDWSRVFYVSWTACAFFTTEPLEKSSRKSSARLLFLSQGTHPFCSILTIIVSEPWMRGCLRPMEGRRVVLFSSRKDAALPLQACAAWLRHSGPSLETLIDPGD